MGEKILFSLNPCSAETGSVGYWQVPSEKLESTNTSFLVPRLTQASVCWDILWPYDKRACGHRRKVWEFYFWWVHRKTVLSCAFFFGRIFVYFIFFFFFNFLMPNVARSFSLSSGVACAKNTWFATILFLLHFHMLPFFFWDVYVFTRCTLIWFGLVWFLWFPLGSRLPPPQIALCWSVFKQPPGPLSFPPACVYTWWFFFFFSSGRQRGFFYPVFGTASRYSRGFLFSWLFCNSLFRDSVLTLRL